MNNFLFLLFCVILYSCGHNTYENYYSFTDKKWNSDSIVAFQYTICDTTKSYDLKLKIRHTVNYEFQNLFLFLGGSKKDTVELILSDKTGKWLGSGICDVREVEYVFDKDRVFMRKGKQELKIEQAMRYGSVEKVENLENVLDVGLIILEHND